VISGTGTLVDTVGRLRRPVLVALTLQGIRIPGSAGHGELELASDELSLLQGLMAGEPAGQAIDRLGVDAARAGGFVDDLWSRGLLTSLGSGTDDRSEASGGTDVGTATGPEADQDTGSPVDPAAQLAMMTPVVFRLGPAGFEQLDHDGAVVVRLSAPELAAASAFRVPLVPDEAYRAVEESGDRSTLPRDEFDALVRRLVARGVLRRFDPDDPAHQQAFAPEGRAMRVGLTRHFRLVRVIERRIEEHDAAEREREAATGVTRVRVTPVHFQWRIPPLALGMIMAHAKVHGDGLIEDHYDLRPDWLSDTARIAEEPGIYLLSHYLWSSEQNLAFSEAVKAKSPGSVTVHGGPNVPKYPGDVEEYFRTHPHVDVIVHGEGEVTASELLAALIDRVGPETDLAALEGVPGLSYRLGDRVVRTADRDRITDLDTVPSPYLTGLFDAFAEAGGQSVVIETNRGCPYGCTFCDWGSATASRIRKYSMDRLFAELEWCAEHQIPTIGLADANFGIFERDVEIAEKVAALKSEHGFPRYLGLNYAKNTVKHLKRIVEVLVDADILTYGQLSLQSMDADTLDVINRSNIKLEKYEELSATFRREGLPLYVDLMMGLPGATAASYRNDLQECINREVHAKVIPTQLLVNSPMNEPSYRERHGIEVKAGALVTSAATFTRADYDEMLGLRRVFLLSEKFGVLRHVGRYVRHQTGTREVDFFERLWKDVRDDPGRWPVISFTLLSVPDFMVAPVSWRLFVDELHAYLVEVVGLVDDTALRAVLDVQHALLPARGRSFPVTVPLDHDYVAWHQLVLEAKEDGHLGDWPTVVPQLRDLAPGSITVDDPAAVCEVTIGQSIETDIFALWELDSPVSRPVGPQHETID
jgi:radical SAM superfamily enzyme YgiQ (UPF0313 family)